MVPNWQVKKRYLSKIQSKFSYYIQSQSLCCFFAGKAVVMSANPGGMDPPDNPAASLPIFFMEVENSPYDV